MFKMPPEGAIMKEMFRNTVLDITKEREPTFSEQAVIVPGIVLRSLMHHLT